MSNGRQSYPSHAASLMHFCEPEHCALVSVCSHQTRRSRPTNVVEGAERDIRILAHMFSVRFVVLTRNHQLKIKPVFPPRAGRRAPPLQALPLLRRARICLERPSSPLRLWTRFEKRYTLFNVPILLHLTHERYCGWYVEPARTLRRIVSSCRGATDRT